MGLVVYRFPPFKVVDGVEYYSIGVVAKVIGKSEQTIKLWEKWSDQLEAEGKERFIPKSTRLGKNKTRCWTEEQIIEIKKFSENIKYGDLAKFSRTRWGEYGKQVKIDRSTEARLQQQQYRKMVDKRGKQIQRQKKIDEMNLNLRYMKKSLRKRAKTLYEELYGGGEDK